MGEGNQAAKAGAEFKVTMMGTMALELDQRRLPLGSNPGGKVLQLLLILLYTGEEGVYREELLDMLYGSGDSSSPSGSLRAIVFRLRKFLEQWGFPPHEYIRTEGGIYRWDSGALQVTIDARKFEKKAQKALKSGREEDYKKACNLYQGEFLSQHTGEKWVSAISIYLQDLYFACLKAVYDQLWAKREYGELLELCSTACELYPYEDCQIMKIDCLIAMKRYKEAMQVYDKVVAQYFEEQGLPPSEKMLERFQLMSSQIRYTADTLRDVQESLHERERMDGPYYCSYPSFMDCYRLLSRMAERVSFNYVLLCCTLLDTKGKSLDGSGDFIKDASVHLKSAIAGSLRKGDLFTCYNPSQYLVLLNGTTEEYCTRIYQRIDRSLHLWEGARRLRLNYQVMPQNLMNP